MTAPAQPAHHEPASVDSPGFERVSTGNRQLDSILGGGLPAHSINIVMGQPGTGKTVFVEQLVFHNAGGDRPILYLTTLSEPLPKLVRYVQGFRFYDENKLGSAVIYDDAGADLVQGGLQALTVRLETAIRTLSPKIIVIDSFRVVHDLSASSLDTRRALYALAGILSAYATMTFLVGEYNEPDIAALPEFAIADGIIEFSRRRAGSRDERFVRVLKLRGSSYHAGAHAFRITDAGLDVYPRLVTPSVPDGYQPSDERVSTGVAGLDAMLGGGLRRGSATLLAGPSGAGKTTIGLHFALDGVQRGEPTLYANFQENPTQLAHTIRQQGIDPAELPGGALDLVYRSPVELQIDSIIVDLFRRIEERQIQRVVIDAVSDLALSASDPQRLHEYLYSLVQHFAVRNVTALLTMETTTPDFSNSAYAQGFSAVADNIILLELTTDQRTRRTVRVVKARRSKVDPQVRELEITGHGARVI